MTTTGPLLQTKRDLFLAFLKRADSVTVDNGDHVRQWSTNERTGHIWIGVEEEKEYSLILTESGIANGTYTPDGKFVCLDQEGKQVVIRFFTLERLTSIPTSVNDKDGVNVSLPPDPEQLNAKRSGWAGAAIETFIWETLTDPEDAVSDLLCNLRHYCDRKKLDFNVELQKAMQSYAEETFAG